MTKTDNQSLAAAIDEAQRAPRSRTWQRRFVRLFTAESNSNPAALAET